MTARKFAQANLFPAIAALAHPIEMTIRTDAGRRARRTFYLSPAQASWVEPMRRKYAKAKTRNAECEGCQTFGLCAYHAPEPPAANSKFAAGPVAP
jgi:hypothetical protein